MFGRIEILTGQANDVIACPTAALIRAGAETYVLVEQKSPGLSKSRTPGEYLKRNVVLGMRTPKFVEVKEGLFPGDRVVLKGSHELSSLFVQGVFKLTPEAQRNIGLRLQPVEQRGLEQVVMVNGTVEVPPDRKAFASSRILGKISRILVDFSQPVRAGQTVAEVASLEFQDLQLDLLQTQSRLTLAKDLLEQFRKLKTVIAEQEVLQRETDYRKMQNHLNGLKRKLQVMGLNANDVEAIIKTGKTVAALPVRSPIDGFVIHFDVIPGQVVRPEQPLFEIHDLSKMWVRGHVFERDLSAVRLGQTVRIRLVSDPAFLGTARLVRSDYVLPGSRRVMSVWAELDNQWAEGRGQRLKSRGPDTGGSASGSPPAAPRFQRILKHNMLARMTISAGVNSRVTVVPISAVLREGSRAHVFVKRPDKADYFQRRRVELGHRDDRYVEIKSGLKPGELVAVVGVQELRTAFASVR